MSAPSDPPEPFKSMRSTTPGDDEQVPEHPTSALHLSLATAFAAALGTPTRVVGPNMYWSLRGPDDRWDINVLIKDAPDYPVVWIFDPHDADNGVVSHVVRSHGEIEPIAQDVQARTRNAARQGG